MSFCFPVLRNWCKNLALVFKTTVAYVQGNLPHLFLQKMKKKRCPRQGKTNNNKPNKKSTGKKQQETKLLHWEHGRNISVGMHYLTGIECWSFKCQHPTGSIYIFVRHVCVYAFYVSLFSAVFLPCMNCLWLRLQQCKLIKFHKTSP